MVLGVLLVLLPLLFLKISRSYSACSNYVLSFSLSGIVQWIVSIRNFRRYYISAHTFLFGMWHLSVAVLNRILRILLIGAKASRYIFPFFEWHRSYSFT